ncbi:MAG: protease modulator HflC [Pseudomonadota bacterium]
MGTRTLSLLLLVVVLGLVAASTLFVVDQRERALVLAFGEVKRDADGKPTVFGPGLHFRMPFVDTVRRIDARVQNLEGEPDRVVTQEKKDVIVDSFVKWKVADVSRFYLSTNGDIRRAEDLLERKIDAGVRDEFGKRNIRDLVSANRLEAMGSLLDTVKKDAADLGVEIVDIRIKQINLPEEVSESVYSRMRSERQKKATELRSDGEKRANIIRSQTDANVKIILAQADQESRRIRGEGDAQAAKIYADVYQRNPEFYSFLRSLDAYKATFKTEQDVMVMDPDSDFFKYLKNKNGR